MTDKTTFVSFLLDETGSMQGIKDDTVGGLNAYVESLQEQDVDVVFSLVSFNSNETRRRYVAEPIRDVKPLDMDDYRPRAMTPLIDAAVKIIDATDEAIRERADEPNVVVVMQTDGQENVSVEYDTRDLARLIKKKTAAGWEFVFLGAGLDAFAAARNAGIVLDARRVMSYEGGRSRAMFDGLAASHGSFAKHGGEASLDFTPEDREAAGDEFAHRYLASGRGAARGKKARSRSS